MIQVKKEVRQRLVQLNATVFPLDKELIEIIGEGNTSEGLRVVLVAIREDLKLLAAEVKAKQEAGKRRKAG